MLPAYMKFVNNHCKLLFLDLQIRVLTLECRFVIYKVEEVVPEFHALI